MSDVHTGPVQVRGADAAAKSVRDIGTRASDVRDTSYKVRTVYRKSEMRRFESAGPGWPPLKESTLERKARQGFPSSTLRATDALYRAMTAPRANDQIDIRKPTEFHFGTTLPYAGYHDIGQGVPQRKLIDLSASEQEQINRAISNFVAKGSTQ